MTPAEAAAELLKRRELRRSLTAWCEHVLAPLGQKPAAHHRLLLRNLEAVQRGDIKRLMIFMPPGSAKSTYTTVLFTAWLFSTPPNLQVIGASHTTDLAEDFSLKIQREIREHSDRLGYSLTSENRGRWFTTNGGAYLAAGVGSGIPGFRADYAIIDDPIRGRMAVDSEASRKAVWDWYLGDLETRLKPDGRVILMHTRWHEDDLAGRLLEANAAQWTVLKLPALATDTDDPLGRGLGEPLWADDAYGYGDELIEIRDSLARSGATREWSAQYQQEPVPDTGAYFHRDWLRSVPTLPSRDGLRVFGASDYAVTSDGGDFTVHIVIGVDSDDRMYVLDLWRNQTSSDQWVEAFCDLVIRWRPMGWAEETGQIRAGIGPWLDRRSRERRAYVGRTPFPTRGDKSVRAQSIRGRMALNGLYIPGDAPWRATLEAELLSFPAGKHDDVVDGLGLIGQLLDIMIPPGKPEAPPVVEDSWDRAFRRSREAANDSDWKVA